MAQTAPTCVVMDEITSKLRSPSVYVADVSQSIFFFFTLKLCIYHLQWQVRLIWHLINIVFGIMAELCFSLFSFPFFLVCFKFMNFLTLYYISL